MQIKVEFVPCYQRRLRAGWAVVRVGDRIVKRFTIVRRASDFIQAEIDRARDCAVAAAVQISSETGYPFNIRDIDYSGLPDVEDRAA